MKGHCFSLAKKSPVSSVLLFLSVTISAPVCSVRVIGESDIIQEFLSESDEVCVAFCVSSDKTAVKVSWQFTKEAVMRRFRVTAPEGRAGELLS